jgi:hypothetical protein
MGKQPNMAEKLAATLLMLTDGHGRPLIDREEAKGMSAQQIVGLFEFDHGIHRAIKGTNHPTNLTPRIYAEHRHKTAKIDVPQIAKTKRIARANDEYVNQILRKTGADVPPRPKSRLPSRPFPKRKMRPTT